MDTVICLVHTEHYNNKLTQKTPGVASFAQGKIKKTTACPSPATEDGSVKSTVYRKNTYTDQYLDVASHHPRHQKLVRNLMNKYEMKTTEEGARRNRYGTQERSLKSISIHSYPPWALTEKNKQL